MVPVDPLAPPAPAPPLPVLVLLPHSHAFSPLPSAEQVCTPLVPPGHAHSSCLPGVHTAPPVLVASVVPEEPQAAMPATTEPRRAARTQPNIDVLMKTPGGRWDAQAPTLSN
jgi:hypothetical protein